MRLLQRDNVGGYSLTADLSTDQIPPYAILSHTWGSDEVIFADLEKAPSDWQRKAGFDKIRFCADQAMRHELQYFWVDTCCIDKSDNIELQTAINSMFRWYRDAERCYVYLSDVSSSTPWEQAFRHSRWFSRGWTLQELIAPSIVDFFSKEEVWLGDKASLVTILCEITGIPAGALQGTPLCDFTVTELEAWVLGRQTKHEEDLAYSLLGIFGVHLPLIYGEGRENAQRRLREEVQKARKGNSPERLRVNQHELTISGAQLSDFSVTFSLSQVPEIQHFIAREKEMGEMRRELRSDGSRHIVVLHGLGGIGKTQLAVEYTKRFRNEYSAIFWLNTNDETLIQQSFVKAASRILQQYPDVRSLNTTDAKSSDKIAEATKAWFSLPGNTRWLMIYDNYDNPKLPGHSTGVDISQFLPTAYQGSIIVTTRSSRVDLGRQIQIKKLDSIDDSLKILSKTSGREILQRGKLFK
jgi:hypothetical protein